MKLKDNREIVECCPRNLTGDVFLPRWGGKKQETEKNNLKRT